MTTPAMDDPAQSPADPAAQEQVPAVEAHLGDPADPTPEPKADPAPADTGVSYDPTGDAGLDIALAFVGKLGIAKDHPAMAATASGDFSLIEAHLAAMGDKAAGWQQHVQLAKDAFERSEQASAATAKAVSEAVVAVAGSAETWALVKDWASKNASADEKAAINAMFDAGPMQARAAATMLMQAYSSASGTTKAPASAVKSATAGTSPTNTGALSPREYAASVRELHAKLGSTMEQSPEYAALRARYAAFRG